MTAPLAKEPKVERLLTYEDYAAMPDDGRRYELLQGRLCMAPSPMARHQRGSGNVFFALKGHVDPRKLGEVLEAPFDVILGEHDTVQPDVVFVAREHADRITQRGIVGAPDLVIEILSEGTASRDCIEKLGLYQRAGVPEYWIVEPEAKSITVLVLEGSAYSVYAKASGQERVKSKMFPELELVPEKLFDPPSFNP